MRGWRAAWFVTATWFLSASVTIPARAHLGHEIARAERYLKLDVSGHSARIVVSLTLGQREGARVLAAADTDASGDVSEAERDAYLTQWGEGLRSELPVRVDGAPLSLVWSEPYMEPTPDLAYAPDVAAPTLTAVVETPPRSTGAPWSAMAIAGGLALAGLLVALALRTGKRRAS